MQLSALFYFRSSASRMPTCTPWMKPNNECHPFRLRTEIANHLTCLLGGIYGQCLLILRRGMIFASITKKLSLKAATNSRLGMVQLLDSCVSTKKNGATRFPTPWKSLRQRNIVSITLITIHNLLQNRQFLPEWRDSFAFSSRREENRGVAAVQPATRDSPPDCPIEIGSNPVLSKSKKTRHPVGVSCLFGPGDRIRTCGLMLPNNWWNFLIIFSALFGTFYSRKHAL